MEKGSGICVMEFGMEWGKLRKHWHPFKTNQPGILAIAIQHRNSFILYFFNNFDGMMRGLETEHKVNFLHD